MTSNTENRIAEPREKVWLGEVAGLEQALSNLRQRKNEAQDQHNRRHQDSVGGTTGLQGH